MRQPESGKLRTSENQLGQDNNQKLFNRSASNIDQKMEFRADSQMADQNQSQSSFFQAFDVKANQHEDDQNIINEINRS